MDSPISDPRRLFTVELRKFVSPETGYLSVTQLYDKLRPEVGSVNTVRNWVKGNAMVPLALIPKVCKILGMGGPAPGEGDPLYGLRAMGLFPDAEVSEVAELAFRAQQLRLLTADLENEVSVLERSSAVTSIVRVARNNGWGAAVWPIIGGTMTCRMHVEDRIDLKRVDGRPAGKHEEVFESEEWRDILRRAHADPSALSRGWSLRPEPGVSSWSVNYLERPRLPRVRMPSPGLRSVLVTGITVDSGVNIVASLISTAIGYGFTMTHQEAKEMRGIIESATAWKDRAIANQRHLAAPPQMTVWSHHAPPGQDNPDPFACSDPDVPIFWLRESDDLLKHYCARWKKAVVERHLEFRDHYDHLASTSSQVTVINVDKQPSSGQTWTKQLEVVLKALDHPALSNAVKNAASGAWSQAKREDPEVSKPFLSWLETQIN